MIVSQKKQFVFVHIYKTGGTSVKRVLRRHAMPFWHELGNSLFKRMGIPQFGPSNPVPKGNPDHLTASELIKHRGIEHWDRLFSFAFVRNPWDWELSHYRHICRQKSHSDHDAVGSFSFPDYLRWRSDRRFVLQQHFITYNGKIAVDFVGRFENLSSDFGYVCQRVGIRPVRLPRLNSSPREDFRAHYSDQDAQIVESMYRADIERFGYQFDSAASESTKATHQPIVRQAG